MFDVGMFELLLIFVLVLLVLGPERLPEVARLLGALSAKLRRTVMDVRSHVEREVGAHELQQRLKAQVDSTKQHIADTQKQIKSGLTGESATQTPKPEVSPSTVEKPDHEA